MPVEKELPQGWAAMTQSWPGESLPDVPTTYVLCTEDTILPPPRQRVMAARLGVEPIEIASDHAVFTSGRTSSRRSWRGRAPRVACLRAGGRAMHDEVVARDRA